VSAGWCSRWRHDAHADAMGGPGDAVTLRVSVVASLRVGVCATRKTPPGRLPGGGWCSWCRRGVDSVDMTSLMAALGGGLVGDLLACGAGDDERGDGEVIDGAGLAADPVRADLRLGQHPAHGGRRSRDATTRTHPPGLSRWRWPRPPASRWARAFRAGQRGAHRTDPVSRGRRTGPARSVRWPRCSPARRRSPCWTHPCQPFAGTRPGTPRTRTYKGHSRPHTHRAAARPTVRALCGAQRQRLPPLAWVGAVQAVPLTAS